MVPRIFVSSTYYDLKYVRERLEKFIVNYGFEAILFENDKVTYQHGKSMDQSAYFEVELCHLMILIIGGRYGSPSTLADLEEERRKYDEEFISITRKEFETASRKNIPILIFVDKNVYSEYQTYKENQDFFDQLNASLERVSHEFKFAHVDSVNIFKFIDIVKTKAIKTFDKVEEIEVYAKAQIAGMFYLYLESLKKEADNKKILDTISELNNVTLRMDEMLTSVGKKILGGDKEEYEKVIDSQLEILLDFFLEKIEIDFEAQLPEDEFKNIDTRKITDIVYEAVIDVEFPIAPKSEKIGERLRFSRETTNKAKSNLQQQLKQINPKIIIKEFNFRALNRVFIQKVKPFIKNGDDVMKVKDRLRRIIEIKLSDELPF